MFKPKGRHVRQSQVEKFTRYSIRKVSFGAASVAVASGLFFLGGGSVQAAEQLTNSETREVQNTQNVNDKSSESKEVAGQASATDKTSDGQNNTSVKESATDTQASEVETPTVATEKVAINTASLEDLVAKAESRLSQLTEGKKTKSVIDDAKNLVNKAKELLNDDTKTQAKVDALAKQLSSSLVILNSIKSETTEEKVNKNQDPRNGQAIPSNGESGFRDTGTVADGTENPVVVNTNDITQKASELEAEIAKVESLISAENAKGEGRTDKEFVGILTQVKESAQAVKNKGNNIPTTEKEKHELLQELKEEVDLLKLYQAKKLDWGAPANNHLANYGNNPSDAVISNLNDTFGTPDFSNATSHTKRVEDQASGIRGAINLGSATYHWKQKEITVDEAKAGALGGWKIVDKEGANTVNIVKPEAPTDIEYKAGQSATTYAPKPAKVYDNNGHVTATGGQNRPNASGGVLRYMISTDRLGNESIGKVNKDYYVELKKQGTTIYKDFDVNPNSHLYANLVFSSAYGKLGLTSSGEKIKMKIVDAYTGQPLSELTRKDGKASDTEFIGQPGSDSDGFAALWRVVKVPEGTTKVRVFVEAGDQPTTSDYLNGHKVEDGYIVAGLGLTPGPALTLTTTVVSGRDKEAYGYTENSIYKNAQQGTFNVTLSNHGGVGVVYQTRYEVTLKVPEGVKLGTLQGTDLNEVNGKNLFAPSYTYDFKYNKDTRELTFKIDLPKRNINPTSGSSNTVSIPFEVTPDFVGEATFEVVGKNGFGGKDKLGNMILPYGIVGADRYNIPVNVNANSLNTSDNPEYKYNRTIYIDSMTGNSTITVPVGTTFEKAKEAATVSAEELLNSEAYREKLATLKATAALNLSETSLIAMVQGYSTAAVKENSGTLKVPVIHTVGSKKFNNQIDINVNVVASTKQQKVVFEGDTIQNDDIKEKITPATIPGYTATTNNVQNLPTTTGKAGQIINVETTVSYTKGNVVLPETVTVPVLVLPKATGNVEVQKGAPVDKVKEVAKAKATALVAATDFTGKLPTGATVTVGDVTEVVAETLTNEKGPNKGVVNVPATYTVEGKTYNTTVPVTINVLGSEPKTVYTVEGTKPDAEKVKNAVTPGNGGTVNAPKETDLPATTVKAGTKDVTVPTTVTYPTGDETVNVPVEVLPKATPEKVTTLKDTTSDNLTTAVKEKAQAALGNLTLPSGVTAELNPTQTYAVPATDSNGDKTAVPVKVQYKDATGTVVAEDTINVPVTVVSSTPSKVVVFEGDEVTADAVKGAVTPGTDGTKGEPTTLPETTGKAGATDVKVDVPVTYDNGKLTETVSVPVTVLPKPEAEEILVAKNSDKEKAKEKVLAKAKKAIEDSTFTGKLPQGATVTIDETATITVPDLTEDTEVDVPVKYTVDGQEKTTTVKVPVTVVEGVPQIVPVKETNDVLPDPEKSVDKEDYPEGSTFRYKTPEGQTSPIDVTTTGDKNVVVEVLDPQGNTIVEVPATVRVVESYPKYVPVDPAKKQPDPKDNINPNDFPTGTTFEYKDNTPVDTTTPGEKPVTVVAKLNGQPITEIPAKIVVVEPKTQYVPVNAESDKKPKPQDSITPDDYPEGSTFEYKTPEGKTEAYDGSTPGEKDVTVVVKDSDGDPIVEVPAKIKVVQGKEQLTPVNAEDKDKPKAEDSITPADYPAGSTFEYKIPEGKTEAYDGSTPGDKPVTVVVKDKDGKVLVEVPATIKVVETKPTPIETPVTNTPLTKDDYTKGMKIPEGATVKVGDLPDLTTPGKKNPVKVTITLPNGKSYTVDVPVTVTPVKEIETPVTTGKLTPEDILKQIKVPEGATTKVENIPDLTTPGKKDPVKVTVTLPNGKVVTVDVPVTVTPVKEIETPVTTTPLTRDDYTKGITIPEGGKITNVENIPDLTTPGKKDPVKVTIELPNGKVITVDVPVTVTPVKEIETPVTTGKLTPEDILKQIKVPEGATTKVENIPDLTTPGKKDPVKVTVTLPNGKVVTVDVPVTVTPVKEIETPVTNTPLTKDDYTKGITIPEGGKVTKVENIPDLTTPGKKDPVKVTIELPNGKVITVDVPVTVTPVKEIETPVTKDKLTPEDILKQIKVPEGATVKVGDLPDLTTPGKKDPVKVTITLPNGKVVTVEVPVNVTPITPIETPVTKDKLTPEDILKQIKVPDGATVKVGDLPDLTTPGKKDPVKVTITLPNGKVVTVEIPVTVTPIEDIVKKQGDPITTEDVEKHIPKGAKVISIGDKPTTDVPGERPSIPVVIELPNGIRVTVNVPVIVTPKVTPVVVKVGTPVTPEDVKKHIELPNGWKVTKVGEIPTTETPGTKPVVKVEIELPDGRKITVDVPVIVTPTVRQIVVPQGTPITPDDVKGHIDLPKEPGWEIVEVGEIPTTIPAGEKPSVKVKVKVPTGEIIEIDVPVIVTPKVTPIVVEVGTPITENDVKKRIDLPEGWEIVEVGKIPTTETPGEKPVVKVKVKLPDGRIITVEVPVTVTPKSQNGGGIIAQNGGSTVQIVTEYLDENGNRITSDKEGKHNPIELEGYEFSHSTTDAKGNTLHHYKKVKKPINQETPTSPEKPVATPVQTSSTDSQQVAETTVSNNKKELPNTGTEDKAGLASLGLLGMLGAFGLVARKKKED